MYHYVEDKAFLNRARSFCTKVMKELEEELRENGMNTQFFLVGSGARNMIAQNEDEPIDFDYNLNIISCDNWNNGKQIKEMVRLTLNRVLNSYDLKNVDDSTSSLTTKLMHFDDYPTDFSMDIGIVTLNTAGNWERLIHEKYRGDARHRRDFGPERYYWNEAPHSNKYKDKVTKLKEKPGLWSLVRDQYLVVKDNHLSKQDGTPSFESYIEAVNSIYNKMKQKGKL